jgi:hypothetical protein
MLIGRPGSHLQIVACPVAQPASLWLVVGNLRHGERDCPACKAYIVRETSSLGIQDSACPQRFHSMLAQMAREPENGPDFLLLSSQEHCEVNSSDGLTQKLLGNLTTHPESATQLP